MKAKDRRQPMIDEKRRTILDAATTQFSQYGFRKTSMEDIAREAGISRPSLYSYFENKEEIFRSLAQMLNDEAFTDAKSALTDNRGKLNVAQRIERALIAFNVALFRTLDQSPHGAELMDESSRLGGDIAQSFYSSFEAALATELDYAAESGEIDLNKAGTNAKDAAEVIRFSVVGLKTGAGNSQNYQKRVENFIRVYFTGLV